MIQRVCLYQDVFARGGVYLSYTAGHASLLNRGWALTQGDYVSNTGYVCRLDTNVYLFYTEGVP